MAVWPAWGQLRCRSGPEWIPMCWGKVTSHGGTLRDSWVAPKRPRGTISSRGNYFGAALPDRDPVVRVAKMTAQKCRTMKKSPLGVLGGPTASASVRGCCSWYLRGGRRQNGLAPSLIRLCRANLFQIYRQHTLGVDSPSIGSRQGRPSAP